MKTQPSECQYPECGKPLGAESKDAGWTLCHLHRTCTICNGPLHPIDSSIAYDKYLEDISEPFEPIHPRCLIASRRLEHLDSDPTLSIKQSTFNLLNAARLMVDPDMNLSVQTNENNAMLRSREFCESLVIASNPQGTPVHLMQFDAVYTHQKMLEACLAAVSLLVAKQDKPAIKARADAREAIAYKKAQQDAKTSTRPVSKPAEDNNEKYLADFMEQFHIKERKIGLELKRRRDKAIESLIKIGIPKELAMKSCDDDIRKERNLVN